MTIRLDRIQTLTLTLAILLCTGCAMMAPDTPTSLAATPTATPQPLEHPQSSPAVQEACDLPAQSAAMNPGAAPDLDAFHPGACYDLTLELNPDGSSYRGTAKITLANLTGAPLSEVVFRTYPNAEVIYGGSLVVGEALVNGEPVEGEVFLSDHTAYRLPLGEPLPPGESVQVDLSFEGGITQDFGGLPEVYGVFNRVGSEEFISLANWYPILAQWEDGWLAEEVVGTGDAVVSDTALYKVEVQAPEAWQLVTTGTETGGAGSGPARQFVSGPVRDFIVLASPHLVGQSAEVDGITIHHWGLPGGEDRWVEALQATSDSVATYNEKFGTYPYAELDVIAAPLKNALGVEYPGVFLVGDSLYTPDRQRPFLLGLVVAHEAAHQWWYGVVGNDVLADPWQDEGLTTFSSSLYQEIYQPDYYEGTLQSYQQSFDSVSKQFPQEELALSQPVEAFQERENLYGPVVYQKGALFFQALRELLGDRVFFEALSAYYADYRFELAPPRALLDAFEASCQCDLDELYREWGVSGDS